MTTSPSCSLEQLTRDFPEWRPWLKVVEVVLHEAADPRWEGFVPIPAASDKSRTHFLPLLSGAQLTFQTSTIAAWVEHLIKSAYQCGAPKAATLKRAQLSPLNAVDVFKSSLCQNHNRLGEVATELGVDGEAFQSVLLLAPIPFLQACNRQRGASLAKSWCEGYCPVCGAWPAFAEVRGIERSRYLRCGRCGAGWQTHCLSCVYCGMTDHKKLGSLVPEKGGQQRIVDMCEACGGYLKAFTRLQGSSATQVMLDDLASVDLDVAALEHGYYRPCGGGYSPDVKFIEQPKLHEGPAW